MRLSDAVEARARMILSGPAAERIARSRAWEHSEAHSEMSRRAYHEAGHCIGGLGNGLVVNVVRISPVEAPGLVGGFSWVTQSPKPDSEDITVATSDRRCLLNLLGPAAGLMGWKGLRQYIRTLDDETRALLLSHWDFVQSIARALLVRNCLTGDEVHQVTGFAFKRLIDKRAGPFWANSRAGGIIA